MEFPILHPRLLFDRETLKEDLTSGVVTGVASIPDGLASGILAGINPVAGLYGHLFGQLGGALFTSTTLMTIQATGAMAIIVADIRLTENFPDESQAGILFLLTLMTGVFMLAAGIARAGTILRFVSRSVMVGFITAVGVNIILGQLGDLTEYAAEGANRVDKTIDLLFHLGEVNWWAFLVGATTIALILLLSRTPLGELGLVVAVIAGSALAYFLDESGRDVVLLRDTAELPSGFPVPTIPSIPGPFLETLIDLVIPALSLAFLGLVQGAGVSSAVKNPDGHRSNPSQDFIAQGAANVLSSFFRGMPVGASMGSTSLTQTSGGKSRGAIVISSIIMIISIVIFGSAVNLIAMPVLAGLLIVVGWGTIKLRSIKAVIGTGMVPRVIMTVTFVVTLLIPLQYGVLVGVGLSAILFVTTESSGLTLRRIIWNTNGKMEEVALPKELGANEVVALQPYGAIFFASSATLRNFLPAVTAESTNSVIILRLRGLDDAGATFLTMLDEVATDLHRVDSKLMVVAGDHHVLEQFDESGLLANIGARNIYVATSVIGEALRAAYDDATLWVENDGEIPDKSALAETVEHPHKPTRSQPNPHGDNHPDSWPVEAMTV